MKKMFTDDLPKWGKGSHIGRFNWKECIGIKVKFIYEDIEGEIEIVDYISKGNFLYLKYKNYKNFRISTAQFTKCQISSLLGIRTSEFKIEIGQIFKGDKRDLVITDREYRRDNDDYNRKWYKYTCNNCGWTEGWVIEADLFRGYRGYGCSCCRGHILVLGINDIPTTAPWMTKYFQGGLAESMLYTRNNGKKIIPICPECGKLKDKPITVSSIFNHHSIGCPYCSDGFSYPNRLMFNMLGQLHINFDTEYSPDWIKLRKYDFYFELKGSKYIIEMDGGWHTTDNNMSGQTKEESQMIDDYKDDMADRHGIEVIRINSEKSELEYIKNNILDSKANYILNLSNINWLKCHEISMTSLVKIVCDYKRDNPNSTIKEIAIETELGTNTIRRYLKKGTLLNWCNYDGKRELTKKSRKEVKIYKNNILLGIFESCRDLGRKSEEIFGVKLFISGITKVCNGNQLQYKGFTFEFTNNVLPAIHK